MSVPVAIALVALVIAVAVPIAWLLLRRKRLREARVPRYPVVLAHGLLGFGEFQMGGRVHMYFRGIAERMEELGVPVHQPSVPPIASIALRAKKLAEFIAELPDERVNIIAHSMGGLDARYAIAHLGLEKRVASLTTIGTPHRGTPLANLGSFVTGGLTRKTLGKMGVNLDALDELTTDHMQRFNAEVPDSKGLVYLSVVAAADAPQGKVQWLLRPTYTFLSSAAGPNDGIVPASSQEWGTVLVRVEADHWAQIGWSKGFAPEPLYEQLLRELGQRGL